MNDEIVSHEHGAAYVDVCFENYPPKDESRDVGVVATRATASSSLLLAATACGKLLVATKHQLENNHCRW